MSEKNIDAFAARLGDSGLGTLPGTSKTINSWSKGYLYVVADSSPRSETEIERRHGATGQYRSAMQRTDLPAVPRKAFSSLSKASGRTASFHEHIMGACRLKYLLSPYGFLISDVDADEYLYRDYAIASSKYFTDCR